MKICELSAWGFDNLHYRNVDTPQPAPDQVLLKFGAASVNYRDYQIVAGEFAPDQPLPIIPGSDGAGQIVATGDNVDELSPGDRVSPCFFLNGCPARPTVTNGPFQQVLRHSGCCESMASTSNTRFAGLLHT